MKLKEGLTLVCAQMAKFKGSILKKNNNTQNLSFIQKLDRAVYLYQDVFDLKLYAVKTYRFKNCFNDTDVKEQNIQV